MSTGYAQGEYSEDAFNTGAYGAGGEDFTMDAEGVDGEAIGKGFVDKPGTYHFEVEEATDEFVDPNGGANTNWRPNVNLRLRVLHTVPGPCPQGSIHFHRVRFPKPSWSETTQTSRRPNMS
ncbi:MAG: hypothetical protein NT069_07690 [Planctomycetota bacterium]|nr:hypothetical protein [Planctomycetota bacterium]